MYKKMRIEAPATSANVGPGFDVFGLALSLYNTIEITKRDDSERNVHWEGEKLLEDNENLVFTTIVDTLENVLNLQDVGFDLDMLAQNVPPSRGMGSSATAIVLGLSAAHFLAGIKPSREELLRLGTIIEGHPDNIAPCIYGNFTIGLMEGNSEVSIKQVKFPDHFGIILSYPNYKLSTKAARDALPKTYPIKDIISNMASASLLVAALYSDDKALFKKALNDKLHEPYRFPLITGHEEILDFFKTKENVVLGTVISGAGPAIITFLDLEKCSAYEIAKEAKKAVSDWNIDVYNIDRIGIREYELE